MCLAIRKLWPTYATLIQITSVIWQWTGTTRCSVGIFDLCLPSCFFGSDGPGNYFRKKKLLYVSVIHSLVLLSFQRYKRKSISKSRPNPLQQNFFSGRSEPTLTRYLLLFFAPSSWSGIFCINVFISSGFRDKKVTLYRRDSIDRHCWPKSCCIEQQRQS